MKPILVIGGGGFAKEIVWLAQDCGRTVIGVLDDNPDTHGTDVQGVSVVGSIEKWQEFDAEIVIAIGNPRTRAIVKERIEQQGTPEYACLIHPSVKYSNTVVFSEGCMVCAGTILTTDIKVGQHVILNLNVTVGHETNIGDFSTVAPMAAISGNVNIECFSEVGTGASIRQGVNIGRGAMLGMGGVLTKNIPDFTIFAGNPAKKLKELPEV
ncbi:MULTISPECIES: acetyltransferase [Pseudoalteromonas]|uniref:Acetyltransferase n=1 Tax=Pseudoalteromonas obscura TaxID=3048491 RepID=A0ABT7ERE1_9GAMM|nr:MULTISPECIES: acetyltransferase [Pseudoalteromonas]MBQ4838300.1 acetyltransferase [Pseudoalteromonas luteoviolacea]MDK2597614.1 acetyltransferase [Pseudoalteromonas sp. P94(2023)]